jgi:predicted PurR-regulated permease PerM
MTGERNYWPVLLPIALILSVAALSLGATVFSPLVFALFIIALAWPMQHRLQRQTPKSIALLLSAIVILAVFLALAWLTSWAAGRVTRWMIADTARFQAIYDQTVAWLESHGIAVGALWSEHFNVGWVLRITQGLTGRINSTVMFWLIVFVYVVLGLLEVDEFAARLRKLSDRETGARILAATSEAAAKIRRYMVVRTAMSLLTGVLVWLFAAAYGLNLALEWGVIAFTLNFIPVLGPVIATLFPTAFAIVQLGSWESVLFIFAVLNVIQFVIGNYLEPRMSGSALAISPTVVLFAVFFWAFLWGIFGAFIGVPIMIAVVAFCLHFPSARWAAEILGAQRPSGE